MGKYGIGARVRDEDGDEGIIVDKRKGERKVRHDDDGYGTFWRVKAALTAIGPQFSEGDRVQLIADNDFYDDKEHGLAGATGTIVSFDDYDFNYIVNVGGLWPNAWVKATNLRPFVVVENAKANVSGTGGGRENSWQPKIGDRVRYKINGAPATVRGFDSSVLIEFDERQSFGHNAYPPFDETLERDGCAWWVLPEDLEPIPLTIEAGKFYKTRDGRKVGPMVAYRDGDPSEGYRSGDLGRGGVWDMAGNAWFPGASDSPQLVAEWVDESAEPKFKVGDKVKSSDNTWTDYEITAVNNNDTLDVVTTCGTRYPNQRASLFTLAA